MNFVLLTFVLSISALNMARAVTIQDCTTKILSTQQYLNSEVSKLRSTVQQSISDTKSNLNNRGNQIMDQIKNGPSLCLVWISQIDSILKGQVNFLYAFQSCEKTSEINELDRVKYSLQDLLKTANNLIALCSITNCQASIDSLYNSVGLIESSISTKSSTISTSSASCINDKTANVNKSLDGAYTGWKKCLTQMG